MDLPAPVSPERIFSPSYIVLSGGNTSKKYGGDAPERDEIDKALIQYSIDKKIPLLGVCKGMQSINLFFGGTLKQVDNHVAVRHSILFNSGKESAKVNSYHNFVCEKIPSFLKIIAVSEDGEVEAFRAQNKQIYGIMWHPERTNKPFEQEIVLLKKIFGDK